jgi:aromatic-L-amino-acid/L-tryptophan decarboxylase
VSHQGDVDPEAFRREAHRVVDWIARYLVEGEKQPVLARVKPGDVRRAIPSAPPAAPEPLEALLPDVERIVVPGMTHWNHPGFFAYFANSSTAPALLAEMLATAFNANAMLWKTCPAATEMEIAVLEWLRELTGLPAGLFGVIHDCASTSTLVALAAARESVAGLDVRQRGLVGQARLRVYASDQAHSSVDKAAIVLGIGQDGIRKIPSDDAFRMDAAALARAIAEDRHEGWTPCAVVATVGTTSTTSIDPVAAVAEICAREGVWLHVDAAYAGSAAVVPELRWVLEGAGGADSLVMNPHKWLFVPVDLSVLYTRRPDVVKAAFSLVPEYLKTAEDAVAPNFMDYGVSLGRRFRALKLWAVMRAFGAEGLAARIREHVRLAQRFREWVAADPGFEVSAPTPLSVVCFRARFPGVPADEEDHRNHAVLDAVNASGEAFLSHTVLRGRTVLRLAIGNIRTEERHVARAWELLQDAARHQRSAQRP